MKHILNVQIEYDDDGGLESVVCNNEEVQLRGSMGAYSYVLVDELPGPGKRQIILTEVEH